MFASNDPILNPSLQIRGRCRSWHGTLYTKAKVVVWREMFSSYITLTYNFKSHLSSN